MIDRMTGAWYPSYPNQTPDQDPDFVRVYGNRQNNAQNGQQGGVAMTPPTIHADIIMVDDFAEMDRYPLAPGSNQMFATKDEAHFAIRSQYANGEHADVFYDKRPPAPPKPQINPDEYARKDEIAALVAEAIQNMKGGK
jgi:hypothetical protein